MANSHVVRRVLRDEKRCLQPRLVSIGPRNGATPVDQPMSNPKKTLFIPVVAPEKLHEKFKLVQTSEGSEPARWMLDDVYQSFVDADGNFLEQFQSTGFDARFFELYLWAYFSRSGFAIDRNHDRPDFIVSLDGVTCSIEATTVNPSKSGALAGAKPLEEMSQEDLPDYQRHELPIRFGSPLVSKLAKRYWELPHCAGKPFVIAIQDFHEHGSLGFSDYALTSYLYGLTASASWSDSYELLLKSIPVAEHAAYGKTIPSSFFTLPGAENISAVLFTNSGTNAKFTRMGYQSGIGNDKLVVVRHGFAHNPDPSARDPSLFLYNLDSPPFVESWGHGLVVIHNPHAKHPLPKHWFPSAVDAYLEKQAVRTDYHGWHVFTSSTTTLILKDKQLKDFLTAYKPSTCMVRAISYDEFLDRGGVSSPAPDLYKEDGWFADNAGAFLGAVCFDKVDNNWAFVVQARDAQGDFRAVEFNTDLSTRRTAVVNMQARMQGMLLNPQRIFPQTA